jgi:hypothetical protein
MPDPVVLLPAQLEGLTLSQVAADLIRQARAEPEWPKTFTFDFAKLNFIRPAGVAFLSNLGFWLNEQGSQVVLSNCDPKRRVIKYLDDSLFFEQHCGKKLFADSQPRKTTRPCGRI